MYEAEPDDQSQICNRRSAIANHSVAAVIGNLRLDPRWDPIRENPRFQALLAKYEN